MKQLDPTQVELEIPISPEEFGKAQDSAFRKLVRSAKIPGFRPGKVPRKIFENTYGTAAIDDRALEDLVPVKYAEAVKNTGSSRWDDPPKWRCCRKKRGSRCA